MPLRHCRILCVSFDDVVSRSRVRSLKDAGYEATATTSIDEGMELLNRDRFDAVIVGHRFSTEEKHLLALYATEKTNTAVVLVCGASSESAIPATSRVYALEGNAGLLAALAQLFSKEATAMSRAAA